MVKKYKHIIWDWNGTIFNDLELCVELINNLIAKYNLKQISVDEYKNIFTIPVKNYYEKVGFDFSKLSFEVVGKEWMDEYERRKYECGLYEEIKGVLQRINDLGIDQSILSAYSQHTLDDIVKYYGLDGYFSHVVGLDNIYAASKIAIGKNLIEKIGIEKGESLMIGDTLHDYEVANAIGADCVLLSSGHQSYQKLKEGLAGNNKVVILDSIEKIFV